jgi:hypothetical protein
MEMSFAELSFTHKQYLRFWLSNPVRLVSVFKVTKETSVVWLLVHVPCQQHALLNWRHFWPLIIMFHSDSLLIGGVDSYQILTHVAFKMKSIFHSKTKEIDIIS